MVKVSVAVKSCQSRVKTSLRPSNAQTSHACVRTRCYLEFGDIKPFKYWTEPIVAPWEEPAYVEPSVWQVLAPYDVEDCRGLLKAAIRDPDPVVFLENEILYGSSFPVDDTILGKDFTLPIGKAKACPSPLSPLILGSHSVLHSCVRHSCSNTWRRHARTSTVCAHPCTCSLQGRRGHKQRAWPGSC